MLEGEWVIDRPPTLLSYSGYRVIACVEGSTTLIVIVVGPGTADRSQLKEIGAETPDGEWLRWRGQSQDGDTDPDDDLLIAHLDRPSAEVTALNISMKAEDTVLELGRVVRAPRT